MGIDILCEHAKAQTKENPPAAVFAPGQLHPFGLSCAAVTDSGFGHGGTGLEALDVLLCRDGLLNWLRCRDSSGWLANDRHRHSGLFTLGRHACRSRLCSSRLSYIGTGKDQVSSTVVAVRYDEGFEPLGICRSYVSSYGPMDASKVEGFEAPTCSLPESLCNASFFAIFPRRMGWWVASDMVDSYCCVREDTPTACMCFRRVDKRQAVEPWLATVGVATGSVAMAKRLQKILQCTVHI